MKFLFVTQEGYNLAGARVRCYSFARELLKYGIDTEVLSFCDTLGAKDGERESQMRMRDKIRFNYRAFKKLIKEKNTVFYIQRVNYHCFAPYFAYLFRRNRIILDLDDWEMRENPNYYLGFYPSSKAHYLTRQIAKRSIFCVAASRFLEEFLLQFNKKVFYIPSGVNTELFQPALNGINNKKIVFSWIGTFHRKEYIENIKLALECFSVLREEYSYIYFDIVGDGIYRDALVELVNSLADRNIILKAWIEPNMIPAYLATVDVGLLPVAKITKFNRAKSPTKLFEYMAMAKPTVSSRVGEAAQVIQDGISGFLAETKKEFIEKMRTLIEDLRLRQQMGENARECIEGNYSLKILGRRLHAILSQI